MSNDPHKPEPRESPVETYSRLIERHLANPSGDAQADARRLSWLVSCVIRAVCHECGLSVSAEQSKQLAAIILSTAPKTGGG